MLDFARAVSRFSSALSATCLLGFLAPPPSATAQGFGPGEAASKMTVPEGVQVSLYASEPMVRQPVAIEFDDRGRMWVVQYLQYPNPEGLKRVSVDRYSRTKYDRMPEAPPNGPKGGDKVTILIDEDRDGVAETSKDFIEGLNLASSVAFGYDGVFVIQTPYLLFYPDKDRDDVPDSDPEVCLTGFGMEDAHSVANSLTWGPDGWLYGLQGSTVTANIRGIEFQQGIWRYHPHTKAFELFCEGGGNMWGLDFDAEGQALASTNFGPYIMVHGMQGAYYWKSFGKHGDLHNPFTYGYFEHVTQLDPVGGHVVDGGHMYRGGAFGPPIAGSYVTNNLLSHNVTWNTVKPLGATFETRHGGIVLESNDTWFAPSDLTTGPDGALYVCDWNDSRMAHPDPDASWDKTNGRVYRIAPKGLAVEPAFDLRDLDNAALVDLLDHKNAWFARRARVLLSTRDTEDVEPVITQKVWQKEDRELSLEALWTLYASGQLDEQGLVDLLDHDDFAFRLWAVRLLADHGAPSVEAGQALTTMAAAEKDVRVQAQLAATAQRVSPDAALGIVSGILKNSQVTKDLFIPLLTWWAIERHTAEAGKHLDALLTTRGSLTDDFILPRLIRRYVADGTDMRDYDCAAALEAAHTPDQMNALLEAVELGLADREGRASTKAAGIYDEFSETKSENTSGKSAPPLASSLAEKLLALWKEAPEVPVRLALATQLQDPAALEAASRIVRDAAAPEAVRQRLLDTVSRAAGNSIVPELIAITMTDPSQALRGSALDTLRRFDDPSIGAALTAGYKDLPAALQPSARQVLLSRGAWTQDFLLLVDSGALKADEVPVSELRRVAQHKSEELDALVKKHWGNVSGGTPEFLLAEMRRLNNDLRAKPGDPVKGKEVFTANCAQCHEFFGEGNRVGPELTQANRMDTEYLLGSMVNPNMVVRKEYVQFAVETKDGGFYNGLISERSPGSVTLLNANSVKTTIATGDIDTIQEAGLSLMPEGVLTPLPPDDVRDLFAYLQLKEPLAPAP
jgi:putative membrane-bound dehydrogenase-like protein